MRELRSTVYCVLALSIGLMAQRTPDFSGTYMFKSAGMSDSQSSASARNVTWERLIKKVEQDDKSVRIILRGQNGDITREYKLDGTKIPGVEPDGTPTVEWAELKGMQLLIRSSIKATSGALEGTSMIKTQKWELSKNGKILTIHLQLESDKAHIMNDLSKLTYARTEEPARLN